MASFELGTIWVSESRPQSVTVLTLRPQTNRSQRVLALCRRLSRVWSLDSFCPAHWYSPMLLLHYTFSHLPRDRKNRLNAALMSQSSTTRFLLCVCGCVYVPLSAQASRILCLNPAVTVSLAWSLTYVPARISSASSWGSRFPLARACSSSS